MAGLIIRRPQDGRIQFNASRGPLNLRQKITVDGATAGTPVNVGGNGGNNGTAFHLVTLAIAYPRPVVALAGGVPACVRRMSDTQLVLRITRQSGTLEVFLFAPGVDYRPGSGLEIRDPATLEMRYTAFDRPIAPVVAVEHAALGSTPEGFTWSNPSGRKVAVVQNNIARYNETAADDPIFGQSRIYLSEAMVTTAGATVDVTSGLRAVLRGAPGAEAQSRVSARGYVTVIDVEGL
jgi:hypothetical protein